MLQIAHILLMSLYIVLPPLMLIGIFALPRRRSIESIGLLPNATVAIATSLLLGISASVIYDLWLGGISSPLQMLLTCYWAAGLICILKVLDLVLDNFTRLAFRAFRGWKRSDAAMRSTRAGDPAFLNRFAVHDCGRGHLSPANRSEKLRAVVRSWGEFDFL